MTAKELLTRKVAAGLTDLQMLVMLVLVERKMTTLTDLANELRRAVPSVSMAVRVLEESGYIVKDADGKPFSLVFLYLSDEGRGKIAWLMGKETQPKIPA